jgi:uncharacterized RDD family membrane protein YckC
MALNHPSRTLLLALLLSATITVGRAEAQRVLCSGNDKAIWAIVQEDDAFTAYQKVLGKQWQKVANRSFKGRAVAMASSGPQLALILQPRQFFVLDSPGQLLQQRSPSDLANWPDGALHVAICDAGSLTLSDGKALHVLALVARPVERVQEPENVLQDEPPLSQPPPDASGPKPAQEIGKYRLGLVGFTGRDWHPIGDVAEVELGSDASVHLAAAGGSIFALVSTDAQGHNQLYRVRLDAPQAPQETTDTDSAPQEPSTSLDNSLSVETMALPEAALQAPAIDLIVFPNQLVIPLLQSGRRGGGDGGAGRIEAMSYDARGASPPNEAPQTTRMQLLLIDLAGGQGQMRPVSPEENAAPFDSAVPAVGRLGDSLIFLWQTGGRWHAARRTLAGQLIAEGELEAFNRRDPSVDAAKIRYVVLVATLIATMTLTILKPRGPIKPFVLPAGVRPAMLVLRLLAFLIDMIPFSVLGYLIFPWDVDFLLDHTQEVMAGTMPNFTYCSVFSTLAYVGYCILAEGLYGRTLGKRVCKICVAAGEGRRPDFRAAALRNITKCVELLMDFAVFLLLLPLLNRYRQRVGDILASTTVIDERTLQPGTYEASPESLRNILDTGAEAHDDDPDARERHEPDSPESKGQDDDEEDRDRPGSQ